MTEQKVMKTLEEMDQIDRLAIRCLSELTRALPVNELTEPLEGPLYGYIERFKDDNKEFFRLTDYAKEQLDTIEALAVLEKESHS